MWNCVAWTSLTDVLQWTMLLLAAGCQMTVLVLVYVEWSCKRVFGTARHL